MVFRLQRLPHFAIHRAVLARNGRHGHHYLCRLQRGQLTSLPQLDPAPPVRHRAFPVVQRRGARHAEGAPLRLEGQHHRLRPPSKREQQPQYQDPDRADYPVHDRLPDGFTLRVQTTNRWVLAPKAKLDRLRRRYLQSDAGQSLTGMSGKLLHTRQRPARNTRHYHTVRHPIFFNNGYSDAIVDPGLRNNGNRSDNTFPQSPVRTRKA